MLIFEVFGPPHVKEEIDYDLHDDLIYFMNADPEFYRKNYFPVQSRFQNYCDAGKDVNPLALRRLLLRPMNLINKNFLFPN